MAEFDPTVHPHRRFNPLTQEYVLVSPHRTKRPWQGQTEPPQSADLPKYDDKCYLCPGNARSGGHQNPSYTSTYVFSNDFAALLPDAPAPPPTPLHPLMTVEPVSGACDVIIFHPRHDLTIARMSKEDVKQIINEWVRIYEQRGRQDGIEYVQIFENKGAMMGCSNPHPHGQVWSLSTIPSIPSSELRSLKAYALKNQSSEVSSASVDAAFPLPCLLCDYVRAELAQPVDTGRIVIQNEHFVVLVPWWAIWPFEVLVLPYKRHVDSLSSLDDEEKEALADILCKTTRRYDNLFQCSFAYSMGVHQRPVPKTKPNEGDIELDQLPESEFAHLHIHFEPPLLRSATVKKFLVGFELMAEPQRDLTAEQAAARLRACSETHYLDEQTAPTS
ncbi:hypothetical protein CVT24_005731 [Panaeolus cyanescens]|uniref:Galactose-1-phosphate uridylyltransferase n=1 Tax=Panaeolus cyanescens TaxID=181874 RepID=A0A409V958_9AGAR|nr:hypothetical protein CVT24_005731 [Panaeolus cyanescens]